MKTRVLVIDDDQEHRDILSEALTYYDFKVKVCEDGRSLRQILETFKPALLLMDYRLPGENGIELCEKIKNEFGMPWLPVILMSAYLNGVEDLSNCNHILHKPFDLDQLISDINSLTTLVQSDDQPAIID